MAQALILGTRIVKRGIGVPIGLIALIMLMVLPIPPLLLDLFFTFSISLSLMVLLAAIYTMRPLEFAIFPTVLLLATLLRLALNVASTRVVLLNGHTGAHAAGNVIESFGEVVIGGNYAVGLVVFVILVIINFVVVTKGAGRISEVSARFTLDAMPGKQMAIDADLNAGIITQEEAKNRRREISQEADFYGAMDGASKFVRGDAIAGILILLINIIGGLIIGVFQHQLSFSDAAEVYALLTIGDGLVAQIPSLLLSTAAAMMVTRVSSSENMGEQMMLQLFSNPKPLLISAAILTTLGLIPGMPHLAFLGLAAVLGLIAYRIGYQKSTPAAAVEEQQEEKEEKKENKELSWDDVPAVDIIGLEIGYRLIPMVDTEQDGELMKRIKGVRKKLSRELGFLVPSVHIRDNLDLLPTAYRISILGVTVGEDKIHPDKEMAINPGQVSAPIDGLPAKDPSFGLDAFWIDKTQRQHAQTLGYTVVDASTVIATHISQLLTTHAHQLLGHEETQQILDILGKDAPTLVEDLTPKTLSLGVIVKVLQNLLIERVSIRDMRTIAEILADVGQKTQEPAPLTEAVRVGLGPMIIQGIHGFNAEVPVMTLDPNLEQILQKTVQATQDDNVMIEPTLAERLQKSLIDNIHKQEIAGQPAILVVSGAIRLMLAKFSRSFASSLTIMSYNEVPEDKQVRIVATVGAE